jgi:hypothetical protein
MEEALYKMLTCEYSKMEQQLHHILLPVLHTSNLPNNCDYIAQKNNFVITLVRY